MRGKTIMRKYASLLIVMIDLGLLLLWWRGIPGMRRPLDVLSIGGCVMGIATTIVLGKGWLQNVFLLAVTFFAAILALEMGEKYFRFTGMLTPSPTASSAAESEYPYAWTPENAASYLAARDRAIRDGYISADIPDRFPGNVFAGREDIWSLKMVPEGVDYTVLVQALKPEHKKGLPLGFEANPDNLVRRWFYETDSGETITDGLRTTDASGIRPTAGKADAQDTYLFLGCSFMMGFGLNDDQTLPYYFSKESGFTLNVLNFAYNNYGPHQALADLEMEYHAAKVGVDPRSVRGVVFEYLGPGHDERVVRGDPLEEPCYTFSGDSVRYLGSFRNADRIGRLMMIASRSRIYAKIESSLPPQLTFRRYRRDLTLAILKRMNAVCLEKYAVPLTILSSQDLPFVETLRQAGIRVHTYGDTGMEFYADRMRCQLFDTHPSAYANEQLAKFLYQNVVAAKRQEKAH